MTIYVNGEEVFKSELLQELFPERRTQIPISVNYGWNDVLLCFVKTEVGFGSIYGTASFKNFPAPLPHSWGRSSGTGGLVIFGTS
ncbi:hypothetical protein Q0F98_08765 [Paenibacillus amylolyticus]|nr:hypothetical protein Q0F98_08765 [Paenibacillus amylolyticus]